MTPSTPTTRRLFLIQSVSAAGLVGLAPVALASTKPNDWTSLIGFGIHLTLDMLQDSHFKPFLGGRFVLRLDDGSIAHLELTEVTARGSACGQANAPSRIPFSVVFRGTPGIPRPQRIYKLDHQTLGTLEIFLVPIGPDEKGQLYEAVFN